MLVNEFLFLNSDSYLFSYLLAYLSIYHGLMDIYLFNVLQSVVLIILFNVQIVPDFASRSPSQQNSKS